MKIIYVHHALREKNIVPSQDDDILPLGVKDAVLTGKLLEVLHKTSKIKAIYTSPYLRCRKTAKIINKRINAPIIDEPRLNEFNNVFKRPRGESTPSESETWEECQSRIMQAIKDIVLRHDDDDVVVCVTSGVNIAAFINIAFGIPPNDNAPFLQIPSCSPIGFNLDKSMFEKSI